MFFRVLGHGADVLREIVRGVLRAYVAIPRELEFHKLPGSQRILQRLAHRVGHALMADVDGDGETVRLRA